MSSITFGLGVQVLVRELVLVREVDDLLGVERDQRDRERAAVGVHHGLGDPARALEVVLEVGRREVLAAGGDHDVLLAAGDARGSRRRRASRGRRCAASRRRWRRRTRCRRARSSRRKMCSPRTRISPSSAILISVCGQRAADGAELVVGDRGGGGDRGGLGHPVALEHGRAAGVEELEDLAADRRRAGGRLLELAAEDAADVGVELLVGLVERRLQLGGDRPGRRPAARGPSGRAASPPRSSPGRCWT